MKFVSTRGRAPSVTAAEALVSGLAPDGGLYVPEHLPAPREDWEATANLTYAELAAEVLTLFFTDWEKEELLALCRKAYNGTFNMPGIIRVRKVGEKRYFTELFHGRTLAFKDSYQRRHRQSRVGRIPRRAGDGNHRILSGTRRQPRAKMADADPSGRKRACVRRRR